MSNLNGTPSCPKCGGPMRLRSSKRGPFYGCLKYPACLGTVDAAGATYAGNPNPTPTPHSGAIRMRAKFGGTCRKCGAGFNTGDFILYENRAVVGCQACSPGEALALARPANGPAPIISNAKAWDGLIENEPEVALLTSVRQIVLPPSIEECCAIPLSSASPDENQQRVIDWRTGEALVAAAAGSGKSFTMLERMAGLVREGCPPERLVTLVYNKKAADDLKARTKDRLGMFLGERVHVATFHGWAYSMINEWWPNQFGRGRIVGVDGGPSSITLGLAAMRAAQIEDEMDVKDLVKLSELTREALIDVDAPEAIEKVQLLPTKPEADTARIIVQFCRAYQAEKAKQNAIDFADMLYVVNRVIDHGGARARMLAQRYTHVQVDEAQDINPARLRIATHLASGARSLVWCGDFRQTIYSFTGSRPDLLKSRLEAGATLLALPVNRRSTQHIVEAGNKVARDADWNVGGDCSPAEKNVSDAAEPVRIWWTETASDEADAVAAEVAARVEAGVPLATPGGVMNYACLARTNGQAADLELAFTMRKLPCRVIGSTGGVWASNTGRDFLAYLRAGELGSAGKDLARIANKPARYLKRHIAEQAGEAFDTLEALRGHHSNRGAVRLANDIEELRSLSWADRCKRALKFLISDLKERADDANDVTNPDEDKADSYFALSTIAEQMGSVAAIDAQIELMKKVSAKDPAVEICTMHKSKGAEWHTVFVCGAAKGLIPHQKSTDHEEERRLFYVALTRAQKVCIVSVGGATPSPFLRYISEDELPEVTAYANAKPVPPKVRRNGQEVRRVTLIDARDEHNVRVSSLEVDGQKERAAALLAGMAGLSIDDAAALNETFGPGWEDDLPTDQRDELLKTASRADVARFVEEFRASRGKE